MRISDWSSDVCSSDLARVAKESLMGRTLLWLGRGTLAGGRGGWEFRPCAGSSMIFEVCRLHPYFMLRRKRRWKRPSPRAARIPQERHVVHEWVGTRASRWSPHHQKREQQERRQTLCLPPGETPAMTNTNQT